MTTPFDEWDIAEPSRPPMTRRELRERRAAADVDARDDEVADVFAPSTRDLFGPVMVSATASKDLDETPYEPQTSQETPVKTSERKRMRPGLKWSLLSLAAVLTVAVGFGGAYVWNLWNSFNSGVEVIDEDLFGDDEDRPVPLEGAQTILLLGSDVRGELNDLDDLDGQRSDTIMVVHIPADHQGVVVMSIMRDSWVPIPGRGENKFNAAMALGGLPLVVKTVESFIDTRIDHVAVIDFEGFKGMTDALGGVTVDNPKAFRARTTGEFFAQGSVTLQGDSALAFVRERYAFTDGDYSRVRNQQLFIKSVMAKVLSAETLTNPARISDLVGAIAPFMKVDRGVNMPYLAGLGFSIRDVRANDVHFFTSPTLGTGTVNGLSVVRVDWDELEKVRAAFRDGTLHDYQPPAR